MKVIAALLCAVVAVGIAINGMYKRHADKAARFDIEFFEWYRDHKWYVDRPDLKHFVVNTTGCSIEKGDGKMTWTEAAGRLGDADLPGYALITFEIDGFIGCQWPDEIRDDMWVTGGAFDIPGDDDISHCGWVSTGIDDGYVDCPDNL